MKEKIISVPNISCSHCVATIEREIGELPGVQSVKGDAKSKTVSIRWDAPADWPAISRLLEEIGYPARE